MPTFFYQVLFGVFGLLFGSFANVLILRDDRRASIVSGRSECPACKHPLAWYELVPVLSYLLQLGRCRSCRCRISPQYPTVELLSAGLWLFAAYYGLLLHGSLLSAVMLGFCLTALLIISVIDILTQTVSLEYCVAAALFGTISGLAAGTPFHSLLLGGMMGCAMLSVVLLGWKRLTGQEGMGEGDVWIATALGLAVGWPLGGIGLLAAVMLGSVVGIAYAICSGKGLKIRIPFGPFLAIGAVSSLAWGQAWLNWYILQLS